MYLCVCVYMCVCEQTLGFFFVFFLVVYYLFMIGPYSSLLSSHMSQLLFITPQNMSLEMSLA